MKPLVSVLLPSKKRLLRLLDCMDSITATATFPESVQFCIRLHSDDVRTLDSISSILSMATNVRIIVGSPLGGYSDLASFYQDAALIADGEWVWIMNDDVISETQGWDEMLRKEPLDGVIFPEIHHLGGSRYIRDTHNPFFFMPNKFWEKEGITKFSNQFDASFFELMKRCNWPIRFIPTSVFHDRAENDVLEKERG